MYFLNKSRVINCSVWFFPLYTKEKFHICICRSTIFILTGASYFWKIKLWILFDLWLWGVFPGCPAVKNLFANAGDASSILGSWRSPGKGNGSSLQYSCLENPMNSRDWWAMVHVVAKSQTWLSDWAHTHTWLWGRLLITTLMEIIAFRSDQIRSVTQSCLTLCDPMNRSTPGLPVHHELPQFTQTHVHRVSDAIQPSHPLSSPSPPAPNPSQHQSHFQ